MFDIYCIKLLTLFVGYTFSCVPLKRHMYLELYDKIQYSCPYYEDLPYRLKFEDLIAWDVFSLIPGQIYLLGFGGGESGENEVSNNLFLINKDGYIVLSVLSEMQIIGLNLLEEKEDMIRTQLEDYPQRPFVRLRLATYFSFHMISKINGRQNFQV